MGVQWKARENEKTKILVASRQQTNQSRKDDVHC